MRANPVKELANVTCESFLEVGLTGAFSHELTSSSPALRLVFDVEPGKARTLGLSVGDLPIEYDTKRQELRCGTVRAPLALEGRPLGLEVLVDGGSVEVFADEGRVAMSVAHRFPPEATKLSVSARGGAAGEGTFRVQNVRTAWKLLR